MKESSVLLPRDWRFVFRLINMHLRYFGRPGAEQVLLSFLLHRTVYYHKFTEQYRPAHLLQGRSKFQARPCGLDRTRLWQAQRALEERGVVRFEETGNLSTDVRIFRLNVLGMMKTFAYTVPPVESDPGADEELRQLALIIEKLAKHWRKKRWKEEELQMVEEERVRYHKPAKSPSRRPKGKKRPARLTEVSQFHAFMEACCQEYGEKYLDVLETKKEKAWAVRSAKKFLQYCKEDGLDPRDVLRDVCRLWGRFRKGELRREDGSNIVLPETVCFSAFLKYRSQIADWIAVYGEDPPKYDFRIVDLDEQRRRRAEQE